MVSTRNDGGELPVTGTRFWEIGTSRLGRAVASDTVCPAWKRASAAPIRTRRRLKTRLTTRGGWTISMMLALAAVVAPVHLRAAGSADEGGTPQVQRRLAVRLVVTAGGEKALPGTKEKSDEVFDSALRKAVAESGLFTPVADKANRDFDLEIVVFDGAEENFQKSLEYAYRFQAAWRLIETKSRTVRFQRIVQGRDRRGDFWASTRIERAVEGAIRDNIARGLETLSSSGALRQ